MALGALAACVAAGCSSTTVKYFKVTSFPKNAMIYVDDEKKGPTDFSRLEIKFQEERMVTLRVEKEGYQTTGAVLSLESPQELAFFLQEAPKNKEIIAVLQSIRTVLDQISGQLTKGLSENKQ